MILTLGRTSKFVLLSLNRIICLFHTLIQRAYFHQSLTILHAFPVQHQFVLMLVEPLEDQMQRTTWHLSSHSTRLNVDGGTILMIP